MNTLLHFFGGLLIGAGVVMLLSGVFMCIVLLALWAADKVSGRE